MNYIIHFKIPSLKKKRTLRINIPRKLIYLIKKKLFDFFHSTIPFTFVHQKREQHFSYRKNVGVVISSRFEEPLRLMQVLRRFLRSRLPTVAIAGAWMQITTISTNAIDIAVEKAAEPGIDTLFPLLSVPL